MILHFIIRSFPLSRYKILIEKLQGTIEKHEEDRSEDSPRDFMDVYLAEMEKSNNNKVASSFHSIKHFLSQNVFPTLKRFF